jgi:hypothetical protein
MLLRYYVNIFKGWKELEGRSGHARSVSCGDWLACCRWWTSLRSSSYWLSRCGCGRQQRRWRPGSNGQHRPRRGRTRERLGQDAQRPACLDRRATHRSTVGTAIGAGSSDGGQQARLRARRARVRLDRSCDRLWGTRPLSTIAAASRPRPPGARADSDHGTKRSAESSRTRQRRRWRQGPDGRGKACLPALLFFALAASRDTIARVAAGRGDAALVSCARLAGW